MIALYNRIRDAFSVHADEYQVSGILSTPQNGSTACRLQELESAVQQQRQQIDQAVGLLQNAAFLAGYHQPPLARDIRLFLSEVASSHGPTAPSAQRSRPPITG